MWKGGKEGFAGYNGYTYSCRVLESDKRRLLLLLYFSKFDVKTRFGPKESDPPRPICYCLQVTEEQIENEILFKGCCYSLEDIEAYTRAGTGKWCLTTNPSGKCCREYLPSIIEKYLEKSRGGPAEKALNKVALLVEEPYQSVELGVDGMTCESCVTAV